MTDEEIERELNYCLDVQKANGFFAEWWMPGVRIDFNDPHPYPNAKVMTFGGWKDGPAPAPQPIPGPTWLDLWRAADKLIIAALVGDLDEEEATECLECEDMWIDGFIDHGRNLELRASN